MLWLWNLYLRLSLSLPLSLPVIAFTGESVKKTQQPNYETALQHGVPMFKTENVDFLSLPLTWPLPASVQSDRQGVIGEYADFQENTETPLVYHDEEGSIPSRPTDGAAEHGTSNRSSQLQPAWEQHTIRYLPAETRNGSLLQSTQTRQNQPTFPVSQNETAYNGELPFPLSGSLPSDQDFTSPPSAGPGPGPGHPSPPVTTGSWGWTTGPFVITQGKTQEGTVQVTETGDEPLDVKDNILQTGVMRMVEDSGKCSSFNEI